MVEIRKAGQKDKELWFLFDKHLSEEEFYYKVNKQRGYLIFKDNAPIGVFRWNMFWDSIPFLTLIYIKDEQREKGIGKMAMMYWEKEMKAKGYKAVMTSTQVNETAQHFYRKMGYSDCGCLILDLPELRQPMEMFLIKRI